MLTKLKNFFSQELKINDQEDTQDKIQLAAAILLIEVNRASLEKSSIEPVSYTHLTLPTICSV